MLPKRFEEASLVQNLSGLSCEAQTAFALSSAERLGSVYEAFALSVNGVPDRFKLLADSLWSTLHSLAPSGLEAILAEAMSMIPAEDSVPWSPLVAYAEDAAAALAYAARARMSCNPQEAAWAARRVYEAFDHRVLDLLQIQLGE